MEKNNLRMFGSIQYEEKPNSEGVVDHYTQVGYEKALVVVSIYDEGLLWEDIVSENDLKKVLKGIENNPLKVVGEELMWMVESNPFHWRVKREDGDFYPFHLLFKSQEERISHHLEILETVWEAFHSGYMTREGLDKTLSKNLMWSSEAEAIKKTIISLTKNEDEVPSSF